MGRAYKANQQQDRQGPAGLQSTRTAEGTLARDRCGAFRDFVAAIGRIGNLSRLHDGRENFIISPSANYGFWLRRTLDARLSHNGSSRVSQKAAWSPCGVQWSTSRLTAANYPGSRRRWLSNGISAKRSWSRFRPTSTSGRYAVSRFRRPPGSSAGCRYGRLGLPSQCRWGIRFLVVFSMSSAVSGTMVRRFRRICPALPFIVPRRRWRTAVRLRAFSKPASRSSTCLLRSRRGARPPCSAAQGSARPW